MVHSFTKIKFENGANLNKELTNNKKANESNKQLMKYPLCSCLHSLGRNQQRSIFFTLKQNNNKIENSKKGLEILDSL